MKSNIIKILLISTFILLCGADALIRFFSWQYQARFPTTAQAIVRANVIPVTSKIDGKISALPIHNLSYVKRGDVLFEVDSDIYKLALAKAQQDLEDIKTKVRFQQNQVNSAEKLVADRQAELSEISKITFQQTNEFTDLNSANNFQLKTAQDQLELAINQLDNAFYALGKQGIARSKIKAAEQALTIAKLNLAYAFVTAPTNGIIANLNLKLGTAIKAQQELFALIENNEWWVNANFKPRELKHIRLNQPAIIKFGINNQYNLHGIVEHISGNVVRIKISDAVSNFPLKVGENCVVTVDTRPQNKPLAEKSSILKPSINILNF